MFWGHRPHHLYITSLLTSQFWFLGYQRNTEVTNEKMSEDEAEQENSGLRDSFFFDGIVEV